MTTKLRITRYALWGPGGLESDTTAHGNEDVSGSTTGNILNSQFSIFNSLSIVFGCGGTGGHIIPALAIAREFSALGHRIVFIGNRDGMEAGLVKREGYPFHPIRVQKLSRGGDLSLLRFPFLLIGSSINCFTYYRKLRPNAVVCTGGFVSGPVAIAAILARIPLFFHESNSMPGLTTRLLARFTRITFVSWQAALKRLQNAPVRMSAIPLLPRDGSSIQNVKTETNPAGDKGSASEPVDPHTGLSSLGIDSSQPVILVSGGSQGSLMINRCIDAALDAMLARGWQLIWQTGQSGYQEYSSRHKGKTGVHIFAFSPQLPLFYQAAAAAVTRAGAMTIAEQEEYRVPAILIPLPSAAANHQYYNAIGQEQKGVAICLEQKHLGPDSLIAALDRILQNRDAYLARLLAIPANTASRDISAAIISNLSAGPQVPSSSKEQHGAR